MEEMLKRCGYCRAMNLRSSERCERCGARWEWRADVDTKDVKVLAGTDFVLLSELNLSV